jgi:hypothetical protein
MVESDIIDTFLYVPRRYRVYHLSHNFEIWGLLVIAVRDDEDNSLPTCKPAGFWDLNDITGFLESIHIENDVVTM